jgi:hypothetical protein
MHGSTKCSERTGKRLLRLPNDSRNSQRKKGESLNVREGGEPSATKITRRPFQRALRAADNLGSHRATCCRAALTCPVQSPTRCVPTSTSPSPFLQPLTLFTQPQFESDMRPPTSASRSTRKPRLGAIIFFPTLKPPFWGCQSMSSKA